MKGGSARGRAVNRLFRICFETKGELGLLRDAYVPSRKQSIILERRNLFALTSSCSAVSDNGSANCRIHQLATPRSTINTVNSKNGGWPCLWWYVGAEKVRGKSTRGT